LEDIEKVRVARRSAVLQLMRSALLSSASDILQTTTSQRPRAARGQTDAQHGQDFSALVESNVSADKAAQQPAATEQSERRTEDSRASQADRSSNAQTENAHNRREQAAARNRDDRSTDAATRRYVAQEAAHETGAQTADHSVKTRAGETSTQESVRDTADEPDLTAEQNADAGADAPATDTPSAITIAVTLNPETTLTSEINTPGAESDAAIADALNAQAAPKIRVTTTFAQLASEAATQDAAMLTMPRKRRDTGSTVKPPQTAPRIPILHRGGVSRSQPPAMSRLGRR
jgi:hypothetical protein